MKAVGIIPARGGSKGVPGKNIKIINGKPLIEYTIETAFNSKSLDALVVSTDDDEIISIVEKYNDLIIVKRPEEIASDISSTEDCLIHACKMMISKSNLHYDIIVTLEPTSPLRKKTTIKKATDILNNSEFDSVMGVVETDSLIGSISNNRFKYLIENQPRRRQERLSLFRESSTIWATKYDTLIRKNSIVGDNVYPLVVTKEEAIDINTNFDFITAEAHLKELKK